MTFVFDSNELVLFSGTSHPVLAEEIASELGMTLGKRDLQPFPDGEISLQILESVRGRDVFLIQSVALQPNYYLMELLVMIDACKRASARSIVPVIPYFGYCRQDRKDKPRVPITAKLVANLIETAGASRVLTMDLHADQVQGFFDIPVDNLQGRVSLAQAFRELDMSNLAIATPDVGSVKLARSYAEQMGCDFAIVDKRRVNAHEVEMTTVIGDVDGKDVLLVDDMISTGGTLVNAAKGLKDKGAKRIAAAITHPVFVGEAAARIDDSPIELILVGNSVSLEGRAIPAHTQVVSMAPVFAEAIRCVMTGRSISSLFELVK